MSETSKQMVARVENVAGSIAMTCHDEAAISFVLRTRAAALEACRDVLEFLPKGDYPAAGANAAAVQMRNRIRAVLRETEKGETP